MTLTDLPKRQREVTELLAEGLSYKEIADRLGISDSSVDKHITALRKKLPLEHGYGGHRISIIRYFYNLEPK